MFIQIDVNDPQLNLIKEVAPDHDCRMLEIRMSDGNIVKLHFADLAAVRAFVGLCNIMIGVGQ